MLVNLNRALDHGLIVHRTPRAIDENYRVIVSNAFVESDCDYSIKQFEKKEIVLPEEDIYQPSRDGFLLHRKKWNLN